MPRNDTVYRPTARDPGGWVTVNPACARAFTALGIDSPAGFFDLPGEVVSGHPDRHVVRVELPCGTFYLKRQHVVTRRERLRNWLAGFGWASRCEREWLVLTELATAGLRCPQWAAVGSDGRGRGFLLIREVAGAVDLREHLADGRTTRADRQQVARRLGALVASIHNSGFTTPDLTAKHVLVAAAGDLTLIDWQSARRVRRVPPRDRVRALATLDASLPGDVASPRDRVRMLRAAGAVEFAGEVERESRRVRDRRSIRDQRQPAHAGKAQRLVWLAGEAVCAVPAVAGAWSRPAIAPPFYGCEPGTLRVPVFGGPYGTLIRGRTFAPVGMLRAALRGRPWRSPGVTLGRVLFHLDRYAIPAPRLLAFGQRSTGPATFEWFALHTVPVPPLPANLGASTARELGCILRQLHDAGCRPVASRPGPFGTGPAGVAVRDVTQIRIVRRVSARDRARDLRDLLATLPEGLRPPATAAYGSGRNARGGPVAVRPAPSLREPVPVGGHS